MASKSPVRKWAPLIASKVPLVKDLETVFQWRKRVDISSWHESKNCKHGRYLPCVRSNSRSNTYIEMLVNMFLQQWMWIHQYRWSSPLTMTHAMICDTLIWKSNLPLSRFRNATADVTACAPERLCQNDGWSPKCFDPNPWSKIWRAKGVVFSK